MPLNRSSLGQGLKDLFEGKPDFPSDEAAAGQRWATLYRQYAANAQAGATRPLTASLTAAEGILGNALGGAFTAAKQAGLAGLGVLTPLLDAAFVAFWLAPPVAFANPPPPTPPAIAGVVSVAPPGVLAGLLAAAFAAGGAPGVTAGQQAEAIATALDAWTKTVMVINTPVTPPGPPAPPVPLL
jgi:hypothetical protein